MIDYKRIVDEFIDDFIGMCGVSPCIQKLLDMGITPDELEDMGFDRLDIQYEIGRDNNG